ncbi:MAG: hypothetical protein LBJ07_00155, partial [Actinomycetes bacterium]|nr:hypothetical protein [Actinomycetes bacterium]
MNEDSIKDKYIKLLEDRSSMEKQLLMMKNEIDLLKKQVDNDKLIIDDLRKNQKLKPGKRPSIKVGISKSKSKSTSDMEISDNLNASNLNNDVADIENQFISEPSDLSGEPEATLTSSFSELDINQTPEEKEKEKEIPFNKEA